MKKYLLIIIFLVCLSLNTFKAYSALEWNILYLDNVNSKNLINYIKDNHLEEKIKQVCTTNICMNINAPNLERDIKSFINKNINYLENKVDENTLLNIKLKGFKIEKIILYDY